MARTTGRGRARTVVLGLVLGTGALALSGCSWQEIVYVGLPQDVASEQAVTIANLWKGSWIVAWIVGAVTWALMLWAAVAYRRRKADDVPVQTRYNVPIEVLYTVVPVMIVGVIFYFTARDQNQLVALSKDPQQTINVVGYRWSWGFNYVDENVYDTGKPVQQSRESGLPVNEANLPTLYLPAGEKVRFELVSPDVIHSFWVPAFLFKMDVIPGRFNEFELTPSKEGTYRGKCAELCGVDHSRMLFVVKVVSRAQFDQHMADLREQGQTGQLVTGRADTTAGSTGDVMGRVLIGGNNP